MSRSCRKRSKNVKEDVVDNGGKTVEEESVKTYKADRDKVSKSARQNLSEYTQKMAEWDEEDRHIGRKTRGRGQQRGKNTRENVASDKEDLQEIAAWEYEEEVNTGNKKRAQGRKIGRENVESDKEDLQEIAAWDDQEEELNTGRKKMVQGHKRGRENVETEKEGQEKAVSKSHRKERFKDAVVENVGDSAEEESRGQQEKEKEILEESESTKRSLQDNASHPRNRKRVDENGNEIESNMCDQCQRNDKGRVVRCTRCKTKPYCVLCMTTWS